VPAADLGVEDIEQPRIDLVLAGQGDRHGLESTHVFDCTGEHLVDLFLHRGLTPRC
jgi:hypothetical protein